MDTVRNDRWWGATDLPADTAARWRIGPLEFWLARAEHEWRFACRQDADEHADGLAREVPAAAPWPERPLCERRLGFRHTTGTVRLSPMLADRSMVVRAAVPIALPPQEELTFYISTPLWLRVEVGEPAAEFVQQPLHRPSDTWFGPDTRTGELCYALRVDPRLEPGELPALPHRAMSELIVRNSASTMLTAEKVQLPLPALSLYATADAQLWTCAVILERREDGEHAALEVTGRPPAHLSSPQLLAGPRVAPLKGSLIRAFGGLLGGGR